MDALLGGLSTRDKIAQLVIPWIAGSYAAFDDEAFRRMQEWVDSLHIGGLLVSVGSPLDVAAKLNRLQERSQLPLLVTSDLEAGTAIRLNGGTPFPPNMGIGAAGSDTNAYELGRITALEGRAVGIHLAFAPVADVNNNPANPIINTRSFGEDPAAVARLVAAEIRGLQEHGMLSGAKHFPGHGDTGTDSHIALPVSNVDWGRLDSVELVPFRSAIAAGVTSIMSAHIALPRRRWRAPASRNSSTEHPDGYSAGLAPLQGAGGDRCAQHGRSRQHVRSRSRQSARSWPAPISCSSRPIQRSPSTPWSRP